MDASDEHRHLTYHDAAPLRYPYIPDASWLDIKLTKWLRLVSSDHDPSTQPHFPFHARARLYALDESHIGADPIVQVRAVPKGPRKVGGCSKGQPSPQ